LKEEEEEEEEEEGKKKSEQHLCVYLHGLKIDPGTISSK
jgi:hypothetical protein